MTEVWFIRHGESLSNAGFTVEKTDTVPLTELGQKQAVSVSKVFTTAPDLIVVTPYLRTQLTALPTLQRFPGVKQEVWPLHEFACLSQANYNNTNSLQRTPFVRAYWNRQDPDYIDGDGAESFNQMMARIRNGLDRLRSASEDFIAVFSHGRIMHTLRFMLECPELSPKELMSAIPDYVSRSEIENCSIIRMTANSNGVHLHEEDKKKFYAGFTAEKRDTEKSRILAAGNY